VIVHVSRQNTVARLRIHESVWSNTTSSRSSQSWSRHLTTWNYLSHGWYTPTGHSFPATSWTAYKFPHWFAGLPFASSRVPFSGHCLWPSPFCRLAWVRKHLWRWQNKGRRPPCSSMLHHHEIYIAHTYRILTMPGRTQLCDWMCDVEQGFRRIETGLQLQAITDSFPSYLSRSIEKPLHITYFLVWGHSNKAQITRLHCTCWAICACSWIGKIHFWRWWSMPICIIWRRSGLGRFLTIQGICQNKLNPWWTWHDASWAFGAIVLATLSIWYMLWSCRGCCLSLTLAVVIAIAITRTAPSTAQHSGIRPVLIIIILVNYLIPIPWSNGQEVAWPVLPVPWWLNLSPEIIATIPRKMLTGAFNLPQDGCLQIGAIDSIPEGTGVAAPPHLVSGFVKHLSHLWAKGCQPLPKRGTPAPVVGQHKLELWKVTSRDWIKKDYMINDLP